MTNQEQDFIELHRGSFRCVWDGGPWAYIDDEGAPVGYTRVVDREPSAPPTPGCVAPLDRAVDRWLASPVSQHPRREAELRRVLREREEFGRNIEFAEDLANLYELPRYLAITAAGLNDFTLRLCDDIDDAARHFAHEAAGDFPSSPVRLIDLDDGTSTMEILLRAKIPPRATWVVGLRDDE